MKLSILIPTLNEAINLGKLLPCLRRVMADMLQESEYEILIVDAESTDNTARVVSENNANLIQVQRGYGVALAQGISACRGDYIITMDADFSHSPWIIPILYASRDEGEVIIASRYVKSGFSHTGWFRRFLSGILNTVYRTVLDLPIKDLSSGFRLYHRRIFNEIVPTEKNYVALQEILMKAHAHGFRIREVPFHYHPRKHGYSKSRLFIFGKDYLFSLFKFWRMRNSFECADYDERAFNSRFLLQRYWQRKRYRILFEYCRDYHSILYIGCSSSQILEGLPQTTGMDNNLNKLRYKRAPYRNLLLASVHNIPFRDKSFDATIFSQVNERLPEDSRILDEVVRVTQKEGFIIIDTPDYGTYWKFIEKVYKHFQPTAFTGEKPIHWTKNSIVMEMEKRGCRYCEHRYILGAELIIKFQKM